MTRCPSLTVRDGAARAVLPISQRAADALQAFGEHFRVDAHADAKVIWHLEEPTRNCRGVEFRSQALEKRVYLSVD